MRLKINFLYLEETFVPTALLCSDSVCYVVTMLITLTTVFPLAIWNIRRLT